jgi:hypothetical protein
LRRIIATTWTRPGGCHGGTNQCSHDQSNLLHARSTPRLCEFTCISEEAQPGDVEAHRPHGELLLTKQVGVIPPKSLHAELIETTAAMVALAGAKRVQVGTNRGRGCAGPVCRASAGAVSSRVIPPVTHATPFVLRITRLSVGRRASGFVLVAKGRQTIRLRHWSRDRALCDSRPR